MDHTGASTLSASPSTDRGADSSPWQQWLAWLSPIRCRAVLLSLLVLVAMGQVIYLTDDCPIDLSGDEAQYWDWSRRLDLSYYSKGPLVALIIRGSCAIFGDTMPAVRFPAVVLGLGTSILAYLLTATLFRSERLALGVVLLNALVPMFIAGSFLMTIDPPYFFCWAGATLCAAWAIFRGRQWAWALAGVFVGIGFLAKYAMMLWWGCLLVAMLMDPSSRKRLRWRAVLGGVAISLLFTIPVIAWNVRHGWVSVAHVARQTGASDPGRFRGNTLEFIGSQAGAIGPTMSVIMIGAVVYALRRRTRDTDPRGREMLFLAAIGLAFWSLNLLDSLFTKVQVNWPAPAYFTLTILTAYFLSTRLRSAETWRPWRGWLWATVVIGLAFMPLARDSSIIFPLVRPLTATVNRVAGRTVMDLSNLDLMERLRGWEELGRAVTREREGLGGDERTFVLCDDYQQTAATAFYVRGQPRTYCAGPYFGKRLSQYDMWPDRRLHDNPELLGKNAVYVGKGGELPEEVSEAFARVERLAPIPVVVRGVEIKSFKLWRCRDFQGMKPLAAHGY
jgi:hypothetical protein